MGSSWAGTGRKVFRRAKWRVRGWLQANPAVRRYVPWVAAAALNTVFAFVFLAFSIAKPPKGTPEAINAVSIFIVPPSPEPAPEPASQDESGQDGDVIEVVETNESAPTEEDVAIMAEDLTEEQAPDVAIITTPNVPTVDLPETDQGLGTPDGIVALDCFATFRNNRDKAEECAGREILSGWNGTLPPLSGEWEKVAQELRRGGLRAPVVGPDQYGNLRSNQRIYQRQDPRYIPREYLNLGKKYINAFASRAEYERYRSSFDERTYIGDSVLAMEDHGTPASEPLSGWRPSWMLREDPNVDLEALDEIIRAVEEAPDE